MMCFLRAGGLALLLSVLTPALAGCQTVNKATGKSEFTPLMTPSQERQVGAGEHPKILKQFGGVYDDPAVGGWVAALGGRLVASTETPNQSFTFTVLDTPVVNAFALPGGYVYVTRGLLALANTEAEVAGVLAHEIAHVTARHTAQRYNTAVAANLISGLLGAVTGSREVAQIGQFVGAGVLAQYSQSQEFEADQLGIRYMGRAGYNTLAQADFLSSLNREKTLHDRISGSGEANPLDGFFATHPNTLARVQRAVQAAKASGAAGAAYARDSLLQQIDGLIYGDSPAHGFARGRTFSHPELRFTFTAPPEFRLVNRPTAVLAKGPSDAMIRFDRAPKLKSDDPLRYLSAEWAPRANLRELVRIQINGLPAATATARATTQGGTRDLRFVAIRLARGTIYRFLFLTPTKLTGYMAEAFRRTTYSFRPLSRAEAARLKPRRLRVLTVGPRENVESLAARMALPDHREERFRVLNALEPEMRLGAGERVKIVME